MCIAAPLCCRKIRQNGSSLLASKVPLPFFGHHLHCNPKRAVVLWPPKIQSGKNRPTDRCCTECVTDVVWRQKRCSQQKALQDSKKPDFLAYNPTGKAGGRWLATLKESQSLFMQYEEGTQEVIMSLGVFVLCTYMYLYLYRFNGPMGRLS